MTVAATTVVIEEGVHAASQRRRPFCGGGVVVGCVDEVGRADLLLYLDEFQRLIRRHRDRVLADDPATLRRVVVTIVSVPGR